MSPFVFLSLLFLCLIGGSKGQLKVGFYSNTCPQVESTVHDVVKQAVSSDTSMAAGLLRLHFHDCFVEVQYLYIWSMFLFITMFWF
jgi:peroxidase